MWCPYAYSSTTWPLRWLNKKQREKKKTKKNYKFFFAKTFDPVLERKTFKMEFDFWTKNDVATVLRWSRAEECRIPNKRVARGGRLHKWDRVTGNREKKRKQERKEREKEGKGDKKSGVISSCVYDVRFGKLWYLYIYIYTCDDRYDVRLKNCVGLSDDNMIWCASSNCCVACLMIVMRELEFVLCLFDGNDVRL